MRLCIVVRVLWPGGVQRVASRQAEALARRGHNVDLVFLRATTTGLNYEADNIRRVIHPPPDRRRIMLRLMRLLTAHYAPHRGSDATVDLDHILRFELLRKSYDCVIYVDQLSAMFSSLGSFLHGDFHLVLIHETSLKDPGSLPHLIDRLALKRAAATVVLTQLNKRVLEGHGVRNVVWIPSGISVVRERPPFSQRDDLALSVSMWDKGRRPEIMLDIASHLSRGRVVVAGSWADAASQSEFVNLVHQRGLDSKVAVTGHLTEPQLQRLYYTSKVALRFGFNELGPGMGALESLGHGLPLITNEGLGVSEMVRGINGPVVVSKIDPATIAQVIEGLFASESKWLELSEKSLKIAESYSWAHHAELLERAIMDGIARRPHTGLQSHSGAS